MDEDLKKKQFVSQGTCTYTCTLYFDYELCDQVWI